MTDVSQNNCTCVGEHDPGCLLHSSHQTHVSQSVSYVVPQAALAQFHQHPNCLPETNHPGLRETLHQEEHDELMAELRAEPVDRAKLARELADVMYVAYGTAFVHSIDLDAAFAEVHRAAMDKMRAGLRRADGKILKPPGFAPPDMTGALL